MSTSAKHILLAWVLTLAALGFAGHTPAAERLFVTLGTGAVTGVYYPAGGAICRLANTSQNEHGIHCSVESTGGSVRNINAIRAGELNAGIAQSDIQYKAFKGEDEFKEFGPFEDLRVLFSLHSEPFTVVVRADSGIKSFDDLKGKRVNIGNPGSGQRSTMEALMALKGWSENDFSLASELKPTEQSQALCEQRVDAIVFTVGHPNGSIQEATSTCDAVLIPVTGSAVNAMLNKYPYYTATAIPGGMYRGSANDVKTFGVKATVVTSTALKPEIAYELVRAVFDKFDDFRGLHPAFENLHKEDMVRDGNFAPTHDGAMKYFNEIGIWK
jgi:TRAP transporter TAXI family solute receptor